MLIISVDSTELIDVVIDSNENNNAIFEEGNDLGVESIIVGDISANNGIVADTFGTIILSGTNAASANAASDLTLDSSASGIDAGSRILAENGTVDTHVDPVHEEGLILTADKVRLESFHGGGILLNQNSGGIFYEDGTFIVNEVDYKSKQSSNGFTIQFIKSIKEHMGIGIKLRYYSSTHNNIYRAISISPGIEYNIFPYSEATYNRFSVLYNIKPVYNQYLKETIYYHKSETLFQHRLACQIKWMKSWGTISSNIYYKNYLHDFSQKDYGVHGNVTLNLIHNISIEFEMHGEIDHAQLSLPNEDASKEQILLRIQELESQFSYFFMVGFSYTFGSSQVPYYNPRMDDWGW